MARLRSLMHNKQEKKLSKNFNPTNVFISHMGSRGEGVSTLLTEYLLKKNIIFLFLFLYLTKQLILSQNISLQRE